jgi:hypothetical protein
MKKKVTSVLRNISLLDIQKVFCYYRKNKLEDIKFIHTLK